jgi:CheY-like chemotaxis protein
VAESRPDTPRPDLFLQTKKERPLTQLILATADKTQFADFKAGLEASGGTIEWAGSGREVLDVIADTSVDLVIADEDLGDMNGLELVKRMVATNPMINCALVSALPPEAYHDASEGLGILMQLPSPPGKAEAKQLMEHLDKVLTN